MMLRIIAEALARPAVRVLRLLDDRL